MTLATDHDTTRLPAADVPDINTLRREVERLTNLLVCAERNYERAQTRTFELSERISEIQAAAAPLRALLREVVEHCIPGTNCYQLDASNIWRRVIVAADGRAAVLAEVRE